MCDITATHSWFSQKTNMEFLFNVKQIRILNIRVCVCIVRCWIWNSQPVCCWLCPWLQWILPWPECKSDTPKSWEKGMKETGGESKHSNQRRHFFCLKPKLTQQVCSPPRGDFTCRQSSSEQVVSVCVHKEVCVTQDRSHWMIWMIDFFTCKIKMNEVLCLFFPVPDKP